MDNKRRRFLQITSVGISGSLAGCANVLDTNTADNPNSDTASQSEPKSLPEEEEYNDSSESDNIDKPTGIVQDVPIPDNTTNYEYPIMGDSNAPITATLYGGWKCPHTRNFVLGSFNEIIKEFVLPGDAAIEYRGVVYRNNEPLHGSDEPRVERAGLAIWHHDSTSYWSFFEYIFQNQQSASGWATIDRLLKIANAAGVSNQSRIENEIRQNSYQSQLDRTMKKVKEIPIAQIPRVVIDGETTAPSVNPDTTKTQFEQAINNSNE